MKLITPACRVAPFDAAPEPFLLLQYNCCGCLQNNTRGGFESRGASGGRERTRLGKMKIDRKVRGRITGSLLSSCSDEKVEESEEHKHGNGGFRSVYWGKTSDGLQIAVKKLKSMNSKKEMEFAVEVEVLGSGLQLKELDRGADIIVATPGRLNDILEMKKIDLRQISLLVLDEADRMLDMDFEPQIRNIINEIPACRQTLMYKATWPKEVRKIAGDLLVNPVQVNIGQVDELAANKSITQVSYTLDLQVRDRGGCWHPSHNQETNYTIVA
ncbi:hypothetical protein AgCh_011812 [Apium graveolens]